MALAEPLAVEVAWSPHAGSVQLKPLNLPAGATVRDALLASGWFAGVALDELSLGIWGRLHGLDATLRDRDRVEVYRPLQVDPKEARRQRQRTQRHRAGR